MECGILPLAACLQEPLVITNCHYGGVGWRSRLVTTLLRVTWHKEHRHHFLCPRENYKKRLDNPMAALYIVASLANLSKQQITQYTKEVIMARIQINDLQAPEKELTAQEMGSVTGGFAVSYGGVSGQGRWAYRGTRGRYVMKRQSYTATRMVRVRQTQRVYALSGGGVTAWR